MAKRGQVIFQGLDRSITLELWDGNLSIVRVSLHPLTSILFTRNVDKNRASLLLCLRYIYLPEGICTSFADPSKTRMHHMSLWIRLEQELHALAVYLLEVPVFQEPGNLDSSLSAKQTCVPAYDLGSLFNLPELLVRTWLWPYISTHSS